MFCRCTDKSNDVHITATESVFGEFYGVVIVLVFTFRINDPTISEKYYERNDNQMITRNDRTTRADTSEIHVHISKLFL